MDQTLTRIKTIEMVDSHDGPGSHVHVTAKILINGHPAGPRHVASGISTPMWEIRREAHGAVIVTVLFNPEQVELSEPIEREACPGGFYREVTVTCLDGARVTPFRPDDGLTFREDDPQLMVDTPGVVNVRKLGTTYPEHAIVHQDFVGVEMFAEQVLFRYR